MLYAVLSGFVLAILAPWIFQAAKEKTGWFLAILPASLAVYFSTFLADVRELNLEEIYTGLDLRAVAGEGGFAWADHADKVAALRDQLVQHEYAWIPSLDVSLTMHLDGLSLLFALLITCIGTFILIYGGGYLKGDRDIPRFYVFLLAFLASMLGLVLSDNLIAMFVFWELTSITSFMLIGYYHDNEKYRKCAHQSMMVTVGGGLAMFAGLILLAMITGSYSLTEILAIGYNNPEAITEHPLYVPMLILILAGCFTKSAQVPFHFWLPNAMAGPTPVSAFLHSATMVKAGVYLMARLQPALNDGYIWMIVLPVVGAITMFTGMYFALRSGGYKQVLAYSTIMALGVLTMLVGIGTEYAMKAFAVFLLAHAMYKATLFMVAGIVDHETGTKDLTVLRGLRTKMPVTFYAAILAALSLGGFIPFFGFVGKELMFGAVLDANYVSAFVVALAMATAIMGVAVAFILGLRPFLGELNETPKAPHEAPLSMLLGPVVLSTMGLVTFFALSLVDEGILQSVITAVYGVGAPGDFEIQWWHGFTDPALIMSVVSIILGVVVYLKWDQIREWMNKLEPVYDHGPEWVYNKAMYRGLPLVANRQTRFIQNGYLRNYIITILMTLVVFVGYAFVTRYMAEDPSFAFTLDIEFYHVLVVGVMLGAALFAATTPSRLGAVASTGVVGFTVALIYILFSAPDLGITQMLVETLTVILLVLVLFRLPEFVTLSSRGERIRDIIVALLVGALITVLLLVTGQYEFHDPNIYGGASISQGHIDGSVPLAHGRNIVNVILVDYRTLDTLGEIFVLALAAMGVYAMVKFRATDDEEVEL